MPENDELNDNNELFTLGKAMHKIHLKAISEDRILESDEKLLDNFGSFFKRLLVVFLPTKKV